MNLNTPGSAQNTITPGPTDPSRLIVINDALWPPNKGVLRVRFVGGTDADASMVITFVQAFYGLIPMGIKFQFLNYFDPNPSDIRVQTGSPLSWSMLGRTAEMCPGQVTMRINMHPEIPDLWQRARAVQRDVLHEFGHALGMIHEHQRLDSGIIWDDAALLRRFHGDAQLVHKNYGPMEDVRSRWLPYDPLSIMHYSVHCSDTLNLLEPTRYNQVLSRRDWQFLMMAYPMQHPGF